MKTKRKVVKIDEAKCNGCGLCIPNCAEGAIRIIDGKARLVSESLCDGLGACLGKCPQDAITIEEREVELMDFRPKEEPLTATEGKSTKGGTESELRQWPVQLGLVPHFAPYLDDADLLISADCVPFAYADFHEVLLKGKALLIGCPKLDDLDMYRERLGEIMRNNKVRSVTYAHMEVPCCSGLIGIIKEAIAKSGKDIPFKETVVSIRGAIKL